MNRRTAFLALALSLALGTSAARAADANTVFLDSSCPTLLTFGLLVRALRLDHPGVTCWRVFDADADVDAA